MESEQVIKDFYGRILGFIITDSRTGNKTAKDFSRRILGTYDCKQNVTKDFYGRILAQGDILASLITQANNK